MKKFHKHIPPSAMLLFSVTRHLFCIHHNISMICLHPTNRQLWTPIKMALLIIYQPSVSQENLLKELNLKHNLWIKFHWLCFNANYFLFLICFFASFSRSWMVSKYACSTGAIVFSWYFRYSCFAFSSACVWLIVPLFCRSFLLLEDKIVSSWFM